MANDIDASRNAPGSQEPVSTEKERFNLCIDMLKAYYDALEGRLEKTVAALLVVMGWLASSNEARKTLASDAFLFWCAFGSLTAIVTLYCWKMVHWVGRLKQVQASADELNYVEHAYYTRYRFPSWLILMYLVPVLLLYAFACAILVRLGEQQ